MLMHPVQWATWWCLSSLVLGCAGQPTPPVAPPTGPRQTARGSALALAAPPRRLAEDETIATPSGATLAAPKGWWLTEGREKGREVIVLEDPERGLRATLLETPEPNGPAAIELGWQRTNPTFTRKPRHAPESPPPTRGWDAETKIDYETAGAGTRVVAASARRFNGTTYVALLDGDASTFSKRWPQLFTALGTLQPKGMHEESFQGKTPRVLDAARVDSLDTFIAEALRRLQVPGASVAVIVKDQVVYEKSFGVTALAVPGDDDVKVTPITANTLFMIGSMTKSMTTMMQATLIDAGKFTWETPVTNILPTFALGDPSITGKVTLWHTACACTGMPQQDLEGIFEFEHVRPEERIAAMKAIVPTTGFGETFQYSNLMVAAGGYAAAHAAEPKRAFNDAYEAVMRRTIFGPLGMKSTTADFATAQRGDHAWPHALAIDGLPHRIPLAMERSVLGIAPAGAVWSNLRDMERYVMTELADGVAPDGKRVVSEANLRERRKQRVRVTDHSSYGLGLEVGTFHGLPMLTHTGGLFGFGTLMFMLPEQRIAVVVLTNIRNGNSDDQFPFNSAVQRKVFEELFEGAKDIAGSMVEFQVGVKRSAAAAAIDHLTRAPAAGWVQPFAGVYSNASLGRVEVRPAGAGGSFDVGEWKSAFAQRLEGDGTLKLVLVDAPFTGGEIVVGGDAATPKLTISYGQMKYVFERVAP